MKKILILSDAKPGHQNQSIALCQHLKLPYEIVEVNYLTGAGKAISYLYDRLNIFTDALFKTSDYALLKKKGEYSLIISAGSTTYYPSKFYAKHLNLPNIAILMPKSYRLDFSHILCPSYDHPPKQKNITALPINLCAADPQFFKEKAEEFKRIHINKKNSAVGIIIGGPNAVSKINPTKLKQQLTQIFELTPESEKWVTTSRRTPAYIEAILKEYPFDYQVLASEEPFNPIPAFIAQCNYLFVTSDSASMLGECVSFGSANVEVLLNQQTRSPNKFEELIVELQTQNAVHLFDGTLGSVHNKIDLGPLLKNALKEFL